MKTPQQKIFELEQKVRLLERQNKFLERQIVEATDKAGVLDKIIEIAEREYKIPIRKKRLPGQSRVLRRAERINKRSLPSGRDKSPEVLPGPLANGRQAPCRC
jgi:hypothetical protein